VDLGWDILFIFALLLRKRHIYARYMGDGTVIDWRKQHLPRLSGEYYKGFAFIFWTHTTENRATGWLNARTHAAIRELILHACSRYHVVCPIYCVMPDHVHLMWMGVDASSDQMKATRFFRQHIAPVFHPVELQKQPHDHVLREKEREQNAFQSVCYYIQENPVRKGIVPDWSNYAYTGCIIPGYPELDVHAEDYWTRFWRMYAYVRSRNE
jgi:putative transposase